MFEYMIKVPKSFEDALVAAADAEAMQSEMMTTEIPFGYTAKELDGCTLDEQPTSVFYFLLCCIDSAENADELRFIGKQIATEKDKRRAWCNSASLDVLRKSMLTKWETVKRHPVKT